MKRVSVFLIVCVSLVSILMAQHAAAAPPIPQPGVEEGVVLGHVAGNGEYGTVFVEGDYAYVNFMTGESSRNLFIIDVSDKQAPTIVSELDFDGSFLDIALIDKTAYLIGGDLFIIDVSDPTQPILIESQPYDSPRSIMYYGGVLYMLMKDELVAYRVDNRTTLTEIGSLPMGSARQGMEILNYRAFVRDSSVPLDEAIRVIDISDPAQMEIVGSLPLGSAPVAKAFGVDRYVHYYAGCSSICSIWNSMTVYDSVTFTWEEKGPTFWQTTSAAGLTIDGPYAYMAHRYGLLVYDLIGSEDDYNGVSPIVEYDIPNASKIVVEGDYIYTNGRNGFHIGLAMPRDDMYLPLLLQE